MPAVHRRRSGQAPIPIQPVVGVVPRRRSSIANTQSAPPRGKPVDLDGECSICFADLNTLHSVNLKPCGHQYHSSCANYWFDTREHVGSQTCPLCRARIAEFVDTAGVAWMVGQPYGCTGQPSRGMFEQYLQPLNRLQLLLRETERKLSQYDVLEKTSIDEGRSEEYIDNVKEERTRYCKRQTLLNQLMEQLRRGEWTTGAAQMEALRAAAAARAAAARPSLLPLRLYQDQQQQLYQRMQAAASGLDALMRAAAASPAELRIQQQRLQRAEEQLASISRTTGVRIVRLGPPLGRYSSRPRAVPPLSPIRTLAEQQAPPARLSRSPIRPFVQPAAARLASPPARLPVTPLRALFAPTQQRSPPLVRVMPPARVVSRPGPAISRAPSVAAPGNAPAAPSSAASRPSNAGIAPLVAVQPNRVPDAPVAVQPAPVVRARLGGASTTPPPRHAAARAAARARVARAEAARAATANAARVARVAAARLDAARAAREEASRAAADAPLPLRRSARLAGRQLAA